MMTIMVGSTMILATKYSPSRFTELAAKYNATCALAPAATLIYKQPESPWDRKHTLKWVLIYGFPPHLHKRFEERFNVLAREGYGMTELAGGMLVRLQDSHMTGSGSVGKPRPYVEVKIVDEQGDEVTQGNTGELLVRAPGIFKGYYKRPKETAERFTGNWFRTGDLFRQDKDGYYYIVGRKKDMIRRTAENISAAEVEMVLKSHPKILDAAVVPVPDEIRREEVKACVILKPGEDPSTVTPEEIIGFCSQRIARFKVPRFIEYRREFPRTPTLKVEKHKLLVERRDPRSGCFDGEEKRWLE
jgi:acyl-CoA synthetase (AMP-forming)/AMP-acid ligase II